MPRPTSHTMGERWGLVSQLPQKYNAQEAVWWTLWTDALRSACLPEMLGQRCMWGSCPRSRATWDRELTVDIRFCSVLAMFQWRATKGTARPQEQQSRRPLKSPSLRWRECEIAGQGSPWNHKHAQRKHVSFKQLPGPSTRPFKYRISPVKEEFPPLPRLSHRENILIEAAEKNWKEKSKLAPAFRILACCSRRTRLWPFIAN